MTDNEGFSCTSESYLIFACVHVVCIFSHPFMSMNNFRLYELLSTLQFIVYFGLQYVFDFLFSVALQLVSSYSH